MDHEWLYFPKQPQVSNSRMLHNEFHIHLAQETIRNCCTEEELIEDRTEQQVADMDHMLIGMPL